MVDLRVDVVGPAAYYDDGHIVGAGVLDIFLTGLPHYIHIVLIGGIGGLSGGLGLLFGHAEFLLHEDRRSVW